ncbi:28S ribosomal protein S18c, mitochondrial isoform X2 [Xiphias gladius]|uniref:28S ribosomal protein S18c, mitochondrial isoform X2 n=1 Tax=Xiphias gladius TaxID=8245 RepID=UPI001A9927D8|nr:28S ribosomal protein S18c, mitochondrial isoform X2 [Xiphias gladius]
MAVRSYLGLSPGQVSGLRSLTSHVVQRKDDMIVKMENPYKEPQKGCVLCNVKVDFKNIQLLSQFISPHTGRIYGRHITGLCGRKQKEISKAVKKAHSMGFMSVTHKHPQFMRDPNVCGIKHLD